MYLAHLEGPHGEDKAGCRVREARPGARAFIRVHRYTVLGFPS